MRRFEDGDIVPSKWFGAIEPKKVVGYDEETEQYQLVHIVAYGGYYESYDKIYKSAQEFCKQQWDRQGGCSSCGFHGSLETDYFPDQIVINGKKKRLELPCASGDDSHRGVRIYFDEYYRNNNIING